jgi:hypothetical protein
MPFFECLDSIQTAHNLKPAAVSLYCHPRVSPR